MSSVPFSDDKTILKNDKQVTPILCQGLNKPQRTKALGERSKAVWRQEFMVFLGNVGVLGAGMAVALPSVTLDQLTDVNESFHLTVDEASWFCMSEELFSKKIGDREIKSPYFLSPSASINTMACPLGGLLVGYLLDRVGRKNTILVTHITGVLGWALLASCTMYSDRTTILIQMLLARFLSGVMIGLCLSPVGVYSAEIGLPRIRGRLILGTSIGIAAGILFMYILGYFIRNNWQLIAIISTVFQIITTLCVLPMPETPSWLMQKGQLEKARKSLKYFRGLNMNDIAYCEEFENEFNQIKRNSEISRNTAQTESLLQAICAPEVYKPLLIMIGFFGVQQCSGIVVVVVFAVQIATAAGVSTDPFLCAVMVGVARIITTLFMSSLFERWGRRPAGMFSASGMTVCMLLLALSGWYPKAFARVSVLPAICIVMHIIFSTMGLLTLPFFMISEVFPQRFRGTASGLAVSLGLLASFAVVKLYPSMVIVMGTAYVFAFYGFISLVGVPYIYFLIPETRGRTLLEIEEYFRTGRMVSLDQVLEQNLERGECKELFIKT
uniref:Major facilitator superfamily (MFS) profile domain-containing protein n=1 Tax=Glossina austeni TaxID=7395 RepID=A0A1A9VPZ0_GLOAU